jgi:uncharacterized membrane protein YebE (DUF533 family)
MSETMTESRFFMWRAIFAMAHADGVVTDDEQEFMDEYLGSLPLSAAQKETLAGDVKTPQDVTEMFANITAQSDRAQFFYFARLLAWSDGDFDAQEKVIIEKLKLPHISSLDMEAVSKSVRDSASLVAEDLNENGGVSISFWENIRKFEE